MAMPLVLVGAFTVRWIYSGSYESVFGNRKRSKRAQTQYRTSPDPGDIDQYPLDLEAEIGTVLWEKYNRLAAKHKAHIESILKPLQKPNPKCRTPWRPVAIETVVDKGEGYQMAGVDAEVLLAPVEFAVRPLLQEEGQLLQEKWQLLQKEWEDRAYARSFGCLSVMRADWYLDLDQSSSETPVSLDALSSERTRYWSTEQLLDWMVGPWHPLRISVDAHDNSPSIMEDIVSVMEEAFPGYATGAAHDVSWQALRRRR